MPELMKPEEAAAFLSMHKATLYRGVRDGEIPAPRHIRGASRWSRSELMRWVEAGCPAVKASRSKPAA
jgi:excisionase family DNA binding protein